MRLILPLFLFGMLVTSCIDNNYDLSEIDTDGVVIGDEFRLPLATVTVSTVSYTHLTLPPSDLM